MSKTLPIQQPTNECVDPKKRAMQFWPNYVAAECGAEAFTDEILNFELSRIECNTTLMLQYRKKSVLKLILNEINFTEMQQKTQNISVHAHKSQ